MKNYLLGSVRPSLKIWEPWTGAGDAPDPLGKAQVYEQMYALSRNSAKKYLAGEWEEIKFTAPVLDARFFQIALWYLIKELWHKEPCNILVMGSDTLFIRPTEIFGKFNEMRMFNYSDPKHLTEVPHNFNADVIYYPATMDPRVWEMGERRMGDWLSHEDSDWALGQHILNGMIWSQGISVEEMLKPEYAWQVLGQEIEQAERWNNCSLDNAMVLHFHGSRGNESRLDSMKSFAEHYDCQV